MKLQKAGMTVAPKRLGKAGDGILPGMVVAIVPPTGRKLGMAGLPERKVIKLITSNGPDGNYMEFDDGERVDLTDVEWRVELSRLLERKNGKMDGTEATGAD